MRALMKLSLFVGMFGLVGCVDDGVSVFVAGAIAPEQSDEGCSWDPGSDLSQPGGTLDVSFGGSYFVYPRIVNQLQRRGRSGVAETNGVQLTAAEVTIRALDGSALSVPGLPNPFRIPMSGYIPPAASPDSPGVGFGRVEVLTPDYTLSLEEAGAANVSLLASIRIIGKTLGDIDIESAEWDFPIALCSGCLRVCTTDPTMVTSACNLGQDQRVVSVCP